MKVAIQQLNLAALIARGAAVAPKQSPIPILPHTRLVAKDGKLSVASTDMDRFAEATSEANIEVEGATTVDAAMLTALVAKHPKTATIELELGEGFLFVKCGRSKVKLATISAKDFPAWADEKPVAAFDMRGEDFERAFSRVRFAAGNDPARIYLQGVLLDAHDDKLHFAATDGHRLAVSGMEAPVGAEDCPRVIVPAEGVDAALKVFKGIVSIAVAVTGKAVSFTADSLRLSTRLIEGTYPDYTRVIPARGKPGMTFRKADFVDCLDRANVLTGEGAYMQIVARPDGETLRLEARNQRGSEAVEELAIVSEGGIQPFGFNPRYIAQFLSTLPVAELTIEQTSPDSGHLIHSNDAPDFVGVIMPMRIAD
jgi:DNA polymerase-3 subunit beta